ncbi:MAG: hypothetical protein ACI92Z_001122 [Paracoccaceae bacterium]|jgi:hypothetical protein
MLGLFLFMVALGIDAMSSDPLPVAIPTEQVAEPQVPTGKFTTAVEVQPILNATRANWIAVREYNGQDLIYVTHLWSWRCGLMEMRIGINGAVPEIWGLPDCHMDKPVPNMVTEDDGLPYRVFPLNSVTEVKVVVTYDDLTTTTATYDRMGVLIL